LDFPKVTLTTVEKLEVIATVMMIAVKSRGEDAQ
jgi:hypothetical protein